MNTPTPSHRHTIGINRRELLQVGYSGLLGVSLPAVFAPRATASAGPRTAPHAGKPKSVIIVFLTGAASHLDTLDMKPDAPPEVRGEFKPTATTVPGVQICEHMPRLANLAHKYALVRSLAHHSNNHLMATHHMLTGHLQPGAFFDKVASRDDWPNYSSTLDHLRPRRDGVPSGVNLPTFLIEGPLTWPGQHGGFLRPKHDPWQITHDPNAPDFRVDNLSLAPGLEISRLEDRRQLLDQVNRQQSMFASMAGGRTLTDQQNLALTVLTSGKVSQAFEIAKEPPHVRDRYGRHAFGQSLLLARRLVQAGVPVVQANMGRVQNWDTHGANFRRLKSELLPPLDRGVSALLEDLDSSGLLSETLVLMVGEFGRSPKISGDAGRDHWASCFTGLFAGGGVVGGTVIGKSDKIGGSPTTVPYSPDDVGATVYDALGIDPASELRDRLNRPVRLNVGRRIDGLYTG